MADRLILGSDSLLRNIVKSLSEQSDPVQVGTSNQQLADSLRELDIDVTVLDPADETALRSLTEPDIVGVFAESYSESLAIARGVREVFPDVHLFVYAAKTDVDNGTELQEIADAVLDPSEAVAAHLMDRIDDSSQRMRQLWQTLRDIDRLAVLTHDNPDPDAIASGVALARIATAADCHAEVCYYGEITHQENRAFINVLNLELRHLEPDDDLSEFDGLALVDHSRPGVNDQLPENTPVDIVIDHHPPRSPIDARFVDLRSDVGATSTLLVGYLEQFGLPFTEDIATALLFGIHVDTKSFSREVSNQDFRAAAILITEADLGALEQIKSPSISPQTLETVASAIQNRRIEGNVLLSCVGNLAERDALAQAADRLLMLNGVTTTLVYGIKDGTIFVSGRSRGSGIDIGETFRDAFEQIGSAGGHVDMAGAQIELGVLDVVEDHKESLTEIVEAVISSRFLDVLSTQSDHPLDGVYTTEAEMTLQYLDDDAVSLESDEIAVDTIPLDETREETDEDTEQTQESEMRSQSDSESN